MIKSDVAGRRPIRVLHVTPTYYPATKFGGPIFSTKAICDGLGRSSEVELRVLTTDSASPNSRERVGISNEVKSFNAGYTVRYCRRDAFVSISSSLLYHLISAVRWSEIVHLTATYSFPTLPTLLLARLFGKPVVWSPRGGLQATAQWEGAPNKVLKRTFERLAQVLRPARTTLHVTAALEAELSRDRLQGIGARVIPNIIEIPELPAKREWRRGGLLRLMFISRLHPKKGLEDLLSAMAKLPEHVHLSIYGSGAQDYVEQLRALAASFGIMNRVTFHGHVNGSAKFQAFMDADAFCLPTHSENFGIVVGEALAHGLPAISTTGAPWEGLDIHECGYWVPQGSESLATAIRRLETDDLAEMGRRGRNWMAQEFSSEAATASMLNLYRQSIYAKS